MDGAAKNLAAFDRMEEKANRMLDEANAMEELNRTEEEGNIDNLAAKYDVEEAKAETSKAVDDELAALKASLGLN
jgi:phage shock protein A